MVEKINLTFLGTGSAIPTKKRNHPAMLLQYKDENILIDCGEGTQRQFRIAGINPCKLTRILITHWHGDHVLGLPGLLQTLMLNGYNRTLHIYGPKGTQKMLSLYLALFTHKDKIKIQVHEVDSGKLLETGEIYIESEKMEHDTPTNAYSFILKEKLRLDKGKLKRLKLPNSYLISELKKGKTISIKGRKINPEKLNLLYKEPLKKITFIMDTCPNKNAIKIAENSDLLICESTYSKNEEELAKNHKHLTSEQAGKIAKSSHSKKLLLTHLSQRFEINQKPILSEAKKLFKNTKIAEDFLEISL